MKDYAHQMESRSFPLGILNNPIGFFGSIRNLIGEEQLFLLYYDDPKLVHDILDHLCGLWMASLEALLGFGIDYDVAFFWEDMAGNNGSLISPAIFREFMSPRYKRMIDYMKARGVKNFIVDTDGKMDQLISLFLEVGINIMYPCERRAGNDLLKIRKQYPELGMMAASTRRSSARGLTRSTRSFLSRATWYARADSSPSSTTWYRRIAAGRNSSTTGTS
jgi:uroporphyrinogen decarboxylase